MGKRQGEKTKNNYISKIQQLVSYLFHRFIGLYKVDEEDEGGNNPDEYLEHYDAAKHSREPEQSWVTMKTMTIFEIALCQWL